MFVDLSHHTSLYMSAIHEYEYVFVCYDWIPLATWHALTCFDNAMLIQILTCIHLAKGHTVQSKTLTETFRLCIFQNFLVIILPISYICFKFEFIE